MNLIRSLHFKRKFRIKLNIFFTSIVMQVKIYYAMAVALVAILFIILVPNQYQWESTYDDVRSIDVFLSPNSEQWFDENEIQLEAHQCSIWKTNFQSRYENFDYALNVIFRTKNGSTEQIGFTRSYENALNCIETNQQDKNIDKPYRPHLQKKEQEGTRNEVFYGNYQSCRWPDASGTYFIFLQAGKEGWRGSVAPYRKQAGSHEAGFTSDGYCFFIPSLLCLLGIVCLIPLILLSLCLWWSCKWRLTLIIILLVIPMGILLSPCAVFALRSHFYHFGKFYTINY